MPFGSNRHSIWLEIFSSWDYGWKNLSYGQAQLRVCQLVWRKKHCCGHSRTACHTTEETCVQLVSSKSKKTVGHIFFFSRNFVCSKKMAPELHSRQTSRLFDFGPVFYKYARDACDFNWETIGSLETTIAFQLMFVSLLQVFINEKTETWHICASLTHCFNFLNTKCHFKVQTLKGSLTKLGILFICWLFQDSLPVQRLAGVYSFMSNCWILDWGNKDGIVWKSGNCKNFYTLEKSDWNVCSAFAKRVGTCVWTGCSKVVDRHYLTQKWRIVTSFVLVK